MQTSPLGLVASDGSIVPFSDIIAQNEIDLILQLKAENAELAQQISTLTTENVELKTKLSPNIASLADALLAAGLESWGEAAITAANPEDGVFRMVRDLEAVAREPASWSQCDRIKQLFSTICHYSKIAPTPEQASAMQAVLDAGSATTGPVAPEHLNFHPWIKSEES
jgi:hypothetical protein